MRTFCSCLLTLLLLTTSPRAFADVKLPAIFGSHMVLQQGQENPVWGWADPNEEITVSIGDQQISTKADGEGSWNIKLGKMSVGKPLTMTVQGNNKLTLEDVLVGEVWLCSGQSNMQWPVSASNDADLEIRTANYPNIRLITVPQVGTQEPQKDFNGEWKQCSPETVGDFSGVGYFYGRLLHQTLNVPIGLIDNSWGGSAAEAWVPSDLLRKDKRYEQLLERWVITENTYDHEKAVADYQTRLAQYKEKVKELRAAGKPLPRQPRAPRNPLTGQHRPGNLYNGVLNPIIGYGIRGAIWYQGESNSGRAYQYRHLFPAMIQQWRNDWKQGDFPFYFVQLADFQDESETPQDSNWAELREAQTMTLAKLPNTGQAVITDLGEAHDIHPKDKQNVANRLARWALARDYNIDIVYRSPQYKSMEVKSDKVILTFDHVGGGLDTFDVRTPVGFTIAGEDQKFVNARAKILSNTQIEVSSPDISNPVAVRYAWAQNPIANVQNKEGLPLTPFRTDDWPGITIDNH